MTSGTTRSSSTTPVPTNHLDGPAIISARATQNLSRFNLDLRGFPIDSLRVDGRDARFSRAGQELTVIPRGPAARGRTFTVLVDYGGQPRGDRPGRQQRGLGDH